MNPPSPSKFKKHRFAVWSDRLVYVRSLRPRPGATPIYMVELVDKPTDRRWVEEEDLQEAPPELLRQQDLEETARLTNGR